MNTCFTCYLTLQCWLQPSQADKELNLPAQSLTVCELTVLGATYNGLFTTRKEWNGHGLFGGFIFDPSCRHQKDPRFISPASGFSQWLVVWAFRGNATLSWGGQMTYLLGFTGPGWQCPLDSCKIRCLWASAVSALFLSVLTWFLWKHALNILSCVCEWWPWTQRAVNLKLL